MQIEKFSDTYKFAMDRCGLSSLFGFCLDNADAPISFCLERVVHASADLREESRKLYAEILNSALVREKCDDLEREVDKLMATVERLEREVDQLVAYKIAWKANYMLHWGKDYAPDLKPQGPAMFVREQS